MEIEEKDARIGHEATVSKVGEDQIFYLMSRGLSENQATVLSCSAAASRRATSQSGPPSARAASTVNADAIS